MATLSASSGKWAIEQSHRIGNTLGEFEGQEMVLDSTVHKGVQAAISALSEGRAACEVGSCIVFSENQSLYFLLWRSDVKAALYERYGFVDPPEEMDTAPAEEMDTAAAVAVPDTATAWEPAVETESALAAEPGAAAPPRTIATITGVDESSADGKTYFKVSVKFPQDDLSYVVNRRYNEFNSLKGRLKETSEGACGAFPGKTLRACTGAKLEARKDALQRWLQDNLPNQSFADLPPHWVGFLGQQQAQAA